MKVLLINPNNTCVIKSYLSKVIDEANGKYTPLGLLYIASFLKNQGRHSVVVLDMQAEDISLSCLKNIIAKDKPDIVGIFTLTFNLIDVFLTAKTIKEVNPHIHITLGGPHVTIYPDETIISHNVDSIILGEGEVTFSKLVDALEEKINLNHIRGLVYKDDVRLIKTGFPEAIHNLDMLPFPDRRMIPYRHYYNILSHDYFSTTMISSRGCPYKCIFCYNSYLGNHVRFRSCNNIISEIEECLALGIKDIFFCDDMFIIDKQRIMDICNSIIERGLKFQWSIKTRVDSLSIDIAKKLKQAGCSRIHFGVESGSQKILNILNKGITIEQIKEAFKLTKKVGIESLAYFMLGAPTERAEDILHTIDFAIQLEPDYTCFSLTQPLPDTDLYKMGMESGIIKSDFWKEFAINYNIDFPSWFWEENLSERELAWFLKYANKRFYLRPSYIFKMLLKLTSLKEFRKKIKMGTTLFKYIFI